MTRLLQICLAGIIALSLSATADEPISQPKRTIVDHYDQSGVPGKEIVIGTASIPRHCHRLSHASWR